MGAGPFTRRDANQIGATVAIVGAGMAGLAAARTLMDHGCSVRVFERGRSVGGRTARRAAGVYNFDHGAQYFTAREPRFARHVAAWVEAGVVAPWQGRVVALGPRGEALRHTARLTRYVGVPHMRAMAEHMAQDLRLSTECSIAKLTQDGDAWYLETAAGAALGPFDALVLAMPPEQAARLTALPEHHVCVRSLPCWCAMAAFAERLPLDFDGAFVNAEIIAWVARDSSKPMRPVGERWVIHASPGWSAKRLDQAPADIATVLLRKFFDTLSTTPCQPEYLGGHRWSFARPERDLREDCAWDPTRRVALCGDWCLGGRVEGAFLSGVAAAQRIIETTAKSRPGG